MGKKILSFLGVLLGLAASGALLSAGLGIAGAVIYRGELFGFGGLAAGIGGLILGYPIGLIAGMVLLNLFLHYRGSLLFGTAGVLLGSVPVLVIAEWLNLGPSLIFGAYFLGSLLAGTAGFYLGRRRSET